MEPIWVTTSRTTPATAIVSILCRLLVSPDDWHCLVSALLPRPACTVGTSLQVILSTITFCSQADCSQNFRPACPRSHLLLGVSGAWRRRSGACPVCTAQQLASAGDLKKQSIHPISMSAPVRVGIAKQFRWCGIQPKSHSRTCFVYSGRVMTPHRATCRAETLAPSTEVPSFVMMRCRPQRHMHRGLPSPAFFAWVDIQT
mmetsp:Transcript_53433/g.140150  ORF Transcript_53433/g.140150 Transcript_53433/m.140150 type:complete len:201 (-) Transcript_53433:307-909(-)